MAAKEVIVRSGGGISFLGVLAILFIGLKLTGIGVVATWSWLWVLSPIWIPFALVIVFVLVGLLVLGIGMLIEYNGVRKARKAKLARDKK